MLELGPVEQNLAKQAYRQHEPIPERIANAPHLRLGLELYLQAFFDLDSERSHGFGLVRIPWSAIRDYALAFELDDEQTQCMFVFIKHMDAAHLERLDSQREKT